MNIAAALDLLRERILASAIVSLREANLRSYRAIPIDEIEERLRTLYDVMLNSLTNRNAVPLVEYVKELAEDRYSSGYELHELQVAFNVLGKAIWTAVGKYVSSSEMEEAFGLISAVMGAAKDELAIAYVSLACTEGSKSIDVAEVFKGTNGV
jgi:hypothetical protein